MPTPAPPGSNCSTVCAALGHCCVGDVSSWLHPSCAMGCEFAKLTTGNAACIAACAKSDGHATFTLGNETFNLAGSCPTGCSAEDGVAECYEGCKIANGVPLYNTWKAKLPDGLGKVCPALGVRLLAVLSPTFFAFLLAMCVQGVTLALDMRNAFYKYPAAKPTFARGCSLELNTYGHTHLNTLALARALKVRIAR
jgi:hypothetical protein